MRSIAVRERVLRTSVCKPIRWTCHTPKACSIIKSLASVFTADRCAGARQPGEPDIDHVGNPVALVGCPRGPLPEVHLAVPGGPHHQFRTVGLPAHRDEGHMGSRGDLFKGVDHVRRHLLPPVRGVGPLVVAAIFGRGTDQGLDVIHPQRFKPDLAAFQDERIKHARRH